MKKSKKFKISKVVIDGKIVTVYNATGDEVKVSRNQRNALRNYRDDYYIDDIVTAFGNNILDENYIVVYDGKQVFSL